MFYAIAFTLGGSWSMASRIYDDKEKADSIAEYHKKHYPKAYPFYDNKVIAMELPIQRKENQ